MRAFSIIVIILSYRINFLNNSTIIADISPSPSNTKTIFIQFSNEYTNLFKYVAL